ncbi:hypothetical protein ACIOGZ_29830 [Kitasatospora sp. NPDC088160]
MPATEATGVTTFSAVGGTLSAATDGPRRPGTSAVVIWGAQEP